MRTALSLSVAACSAVRITFELFGSTRTWLLGTASIAARMSAADGFIDWPPSITRVAPRLSKRRLFPRPGHTATSPVTSVAAAVGAPSSSRSSRCAVWWCMFAISTPDHSDRRPQVQRFAGIVGVDVHLQGRLVADDEQRVADPLELAPRVSLSRFSPSTTKTVQ